MEQCIFRIRKRINGMVQFRNIPESSKSELVKRNAMNALLIPLGLYNLVMRYRPRILIKKIQRLRLHLV